MPRWSERVSLPGGGVAIVCYSGKRPSPPCACGRPSTLQCDYPVEHGRTCDAFMCRRCADRVGKCTDYCARHRRQVELISVVMVAPAQQAERTKCGSRTSGTNPRTRRRAKASRCFNGWKAFIGAGSARATLKG